MKTECIRLDPTRGDVTLTTYLLQDSPELLAGKKRPAITGCPTGFFVEAAEDSICLALPRERYAAQLHQDLRFLHWLLKEMTEKFIHGMGVEIAPATLEKKVLQFFEKETAGEISAVETLLFQLRCGRRELQRVLKKLCDDGQLERLGRGHYRLTEQNGNSADPADPEHGQ